MTLKLENLPWSNFGLLENIPAVRGMLVYFISWPLAIYHEGAGFLVLWGNNSVLLAVVAHVFLQQPPPPPAGVSLGSLPQPTQPTFPWKWYFFGPWRQRRWMRALAPQKLNPLRGVENAIPLCHPAGGRVVGAVSPFFFLKNHLTSSIKVQTKITWNKHKFWNTSIFHLCGFRWHLRISLCSKNRWTLSVGIHYGNDVLGLRGPHTRARARGKQATFEQFALRSQR